MSGDRRDTCECGKVKMIRSHYCVDCYKSKRRATRKRKHSLAHTLTSNERDAYGMIASVINLDTGETQSFHRPGTAGEALDDILAELDGREGDWRITCLSTPVTIVRDLHGTRTAIDKSFYDTRQTHPHTPEEFYLGKRKRRDLMAPESTPTAVWEGPRRR